MMKNKSRYVYLITNQLNNKQYVGSRVCYVPVNEDNYMGSSKYLNEDVSIYGISNFSKQIIKEGYTNKFDMLDDETKYILEYNTLSPNGYNRYLPNKSYGFHMDGVTHSSEVNIKKGRKGRIIKPESIVKMLITRQLHIKEIREKISTSKLGKTYSPEVNIKKGRKGRIIKPESIAKMKETRKLPEVAARISESCRKSSTGRKFTTEQNAKKGRKGRKMSPESIEKRTLSRKLKKTQLLS